MQHVLIHIIPTLGSGGAENVLCRIVEDFHSRGIIQYVFSTQGNSDDFNHKRIAPFCEVIHKISQPEKVKKIFRDHPNAIILGWMYKGIAAAHLWKFLYGKNTQRLIWNIRHSNFGPRQYYQKIMLFVFGLMSRFLKPKVIYCSYRSKQVHENALFTKYNKKVIVNRLAKLPPAQIKAKQHSKPYLLFVGRFNPQKGPKYFLAISQKILATHSDLEIWIAGKGWDINFFPLSLHPRIKILGQQKEIYPLYKNASVFLFTSIYGEGYPNVLAEAMAVGTPVVAFDAGDAKQMLENYAHGKIVDNVNEFVVQVNYYLDHPLTELQREGEAQRQCQDLSFTITLQEYRNFIFDLG